jgi:hypothetical protein
MGTLYKATAPYPASSYQADQPQESPKSGIRAFPYKYCHPYQHLTKKEASTQDGDFSSASAISY